jgi:ribosomal protein S21
MAGVRVRDLVPIEAAIRRFHRGDTSAWIPSELRNREDFPEPEERRKQQLAAVKKRYLRRIALAGV